MSQVPNSCKSWYVLPKWEKLWAIETCTAIPFAKFLYFVSINFQESVIKLAVARKTFANCKVKCSGKIVKIEGETSTKNLKIYKFCPTKIYSFNNAPLSLAPVE